LIQDKNVPFYFKLTELIAHLAQRTSKIHEITGEIQSSPLSPSCSVKTVRNFDWESKEVS